MPYFVLGIAAAADGKPVEQGVGIHADDGLEFRGLRLQVAQIFFWQARVKASIIPLP